MGTAEDTLKTYGYRVNTREEFLAATDRPEGLLERAQGLNVAYRFGDLMTRYDHVVWDPECDVDGWMLWGNDREEIAQETLDTDIAMP